MPSPSRERAATSSKSFAASERRAARSMSVPAPLVHSYSAHDGSVKHGRRWQELVDRHAVASGSSKAVTSDSEAASVRVWLLGRFRQGPAITGGGDCRRSGLTLTCGLRPSDMPPQTQTPAAPGASRSQYHSKLHHGDGRPHSV